MAVSTRLRRNIAWLVAAVVAGALVAGFVIEQGPSLSGDTIALVHGARTIEHCLSKGVYSYCDRQAPWSGGGVSTDTYHGIVEGDVAPYPLFQYVPAVVLTELGATDAAVYRWFSLISLIAFCTLIGMAARVGLWTGRRWAPALAVLIVTTSPLLFYAGSTFGESLAATLVALVTVVSLRRWPAPVLSLSVFVACLTKETIFPVVALLAAACLSATPVAARSLRRSHWWGLGTGVTAGIAVSAAFNWFRYHQLTNFTYGHSYEQVPGIVRRLGFGVAIWLAPNGGVAAFWPLGALGAIGVVAVAVHALKRGDRTGAVPALLLIVAMLWMTGTLASWYSPFGWEAWGPRLMLPALPAFLLAALAIYADRLEGVLTVLVRTRTRIALVAIVILALALPQINILHAGQAEGELFLPDRVCPTPASVVSDPTYYYHCVSHMAWLHHLVLLNTFPALRTPWGIIFAVGFLAIWSSLIVLVSLGSWPRWPTRRAAATASHGRSAPVTRA